MKLRNIDSSQLVVFSGEDFLSRFLFYSMINLVSSGRQSEVQALDYLF